MEIELQEGIWQAEALEAMSTLRIHSASIKAIGFTVGYLHRAQEDFELITRLKKFEVIARCPYEHRFYAGLSKGFCNKCGWFQTMSEEVRMK